MPWGEAITRGTAQLAVACYLLRVLADLSGSPSQSLAVWTRRSWTLGALAMAVHVGAAFQFVHHWSHAEAVRHTAEQTAQVTGWDWGGGIYFNYAFAAYWLFDAFRWRRRKAQTNPPRFQFWATHAAFAFMMFNATVVFGPAYWTWVALMFGGAVLLIWRFSRPRRAGKSEVRISKSEINPHDRDSKNQTPRFGCALLFGTFGIGVLNLFRISDFVLRI